MNNYNNNYFMSQNHYQPRGPHGDFYGPRARKMGPMHQFRPRQGGGFPQYGNFGNGYQNHDRYRQPRYPFPSPYYNGTKRRIPNPSSSIMRVSSPPFQQRFSERRREAGSQNFERENSQPPYVLRASTDEPDFPRRIASHYTELSASLNFTIRTGTYGMAPSNQRRRRGFPLTPVNYVDDPVNIYEQDVDSFGDSEPMDDDGAITFQGTVAVGSEPVIFPSYSTTSPGVQDQITMSSENKIENHSQDEEPYEPENPDMISSRQTPSKVPNALIECDINLRQQQTMASCDTDGFHEAFVGVVISRYPSVLGRQIEVAGYGVWFSDGHKRNLYGVLKPERPQTLKAVMIYGSARAIENMKREGKFQKPPTTLKFIAAFKGYFRIRINVESEYLNSNVIAWISKYMENSKAPPSNWDEVKYLPEILDLCSSSTGMIIKWSHCCEISMKKPGIEKAKQLAKKATDLWMKDYRIRREAVGTADYSVNENAESDNGNKKEHEKH